MEKAFMILGEYGEVIVDVFQVASIEAVAKLDAAGQPMLPSTRGYVGKPQFAGSTILLNSGQRLSVPQSHSTVLELAVEAANPKIN